MSGPVDCEPLKDFAPDQAPEAVQAVAFVEDQLKVALAPFAIVLGVALRLTLVVGLGFTVTVADWLAVPPRPEQLRV